MITGLNHITLAVTDLKRSFAFYRDVLALKPLVKWNKGAYLIAGDLWFCLSLDPFTKPSPDYTHIAFTVSAADYEEISERIIFSGATIFKENNSPGDSLYFLDPDGHKLEIHTSDWQTRLVSKKDNPGTWKNIEWY